MADENEELTLHNDFRVYGSIHKSKSYLLCPHCDEECGCEAMEDGCGHCPEEEYSDVSV